MQLKAEIWANHQIRFVEVKPGAWAAISKDISDALNYRDANSMVRHIDKKYLVYVKMTDMNQKYLALTEFGIYKAIFNSHKPEAEAFQEWVFEMLKKLRESSGLAGFEVFRMLDKDFQKKQMADLDAGIDRAKQKHYLKANTIANKAISTLHGYSKMIGKKQMTPDMLKEREPILSDTVDLMVAKDRFGLDVHVSKAIYRKYKAVKNDV
jgi:Prophage antirepressor